MNRIVILESDKEYLSELGKAFSGCEDFEVCGTATDGNDGISLINAQKPDIVLLDTVLSGRDGLSVLEYISAHLGGCRAFIISPFPDGETVTKAVASGAKYYFCKPVFADTVLNTVRRLMRPVNSAPKTDVILDKKISNIFLTIGIPPSILGFQYLREGVKMAVAEPLIINSITKRLYPEIAVKFNTSASKVERAIRHAIEVAWNKGRSDSINAIFNAKVFNANERPTNSEFIALLAEKLILDSLV